MTDLARPVSLSTTGVDWLSRMASFRLIAFFGVSDPEPLRA